jgi:hypothetical protein
MACDTLRVISVAQVRKVCGGSIYLVCMYYISDDLAEKLNRIYFANELFNPFAQESNQLV